MTTDNQETKQNAHDFDPQAPENFTSAHEEYKEMRSKCPVAHSNTWGGFWSLLKHEDVTDVLKDYKRYTTSKQNVVPKFAFSGRRPPLHLDPPEHTAYRRVINQFFTKGKMNELDDDVREDSIALIQPFVDKNGGDFSEEYAHKFPVHVFSRFFHVSKNLSEQIKEVSSAYVRAIQEVDDETVKRLSYKLYDISREIINQRKAEEMDPKDDLTSALLNAEYDGEKLPEDMVLGTVRQLLVTGMVAPSVVLGSMFAYLAKDQELQEQLRQDPSLLPAALEELFRMFTPYRGMARTPKEDVEIGGYTIKKDEPIALNYASANRDEDVFPEPDKFILNRPNINEHIAFGEGPHNCAGAPLARKMMHISIEEFLKRTENFEFNGEIEMTRWAEWGVLSLPLSVEKA
ncbi:cytochrome P450 [Salibacterium aidingense]|uniref:cytochrome P450 n=1 Tax=Salibacterium aidingense TaxID=384933 RepID=UPI003BEC43DD